MKLAAIQENFQAALLGGEYGILATLADGARETKEALLGVYRDGYMLRLIEFVQNDHELLRVYLGDDEFEAMARGYAAAHPSRNRNARYFCQHLPAFLAETLPYSSYPQLAELAALEKALNDAFDAADAPCLDARSLKTVAAADWPALVFTPQPSVTLLDLQTNAADIWRALRADAEPPQAASLSAPEYLLVWREDVPKFRSLDAHEAKLWDAAAEGATFAALCALAALHGDPADAAFRVASLLQGWLASGVLAG